MPADLADAFYSLTPRLIRGLCRAFPQVCPALAVDAVWDAYAIALQRPTSFERALARGPRDLYRLFRKVSWRQLRGHTRRHATRCEEGKDSLEGFGQSPGQELAAGYPQRLGALLDEASLRFGGERAGALRGALEDRVLSGDPDAEVAARWDLPREYLNRAKRHVQRGLWDATLGA